MEYPQKFVTTFLSFIFVVSTASCKNDVSKKENTPPPIAQKINATQNKKTTKSTKPKAELGKPKATKVKTTKWIAENVLTKNRNKRWEIKRKRWRKENASTSNLYVAFLEKDEYIEKLIDRGKSRPRQITITRKKGGKQRLLFSTHAKGCKDFDLVSIDLSSAVSTKEYLLLEINCERDQEDPTYYLGEAENHFSLFEITKTTVTKIWAKTFEVTNDEIKPCGKFAEVELEIDNAKLTLSITQGTEWYGKTPKPKECKETSTTNTVSPPS